MARVLKTSDRKPEGVDFGDTMAQLPTPPDGAALTAVNVLAVDLFVFDRKAPRTPIWSTSISPASVIYSTYQTDFRWDIDTIGYNFRHYLRRDLVFAGATKEQGGHTYRLEYVITTGSSVGLGRIVISREVYSVPTFCDIDSTGGGGGPPPTPDFALSISPPTVQINAGDSTTYTVSNVGSNGFVGQIALTVGPAIPGVSYSLAADTINNDSSTILTVLTDGGTLPANYTIQVTGTSGALSHDAFAGLVVEANAGDFSLTANPPSITIEQGQEGTVSILSTSISGFLGSITFGVTPPIADVTYDVSPNPILAGNQTTLTITVGATAPVGPYQIIVTGTSGSLVHTCSTLLNLNPAGGNTTGWTTFTASGDTRKVYVSAAGNDGNSGLDDTHPKLTLRAGAALLREGFPDWLLLRSGDTWTNQQLIDGSGNGGDHYWTKSGRSLAETMLISTYTTGNAALDTFGARAKIDVTASGNLSAAFLTWNQTPQGAAFPYASNISLVNLEFTSTAYTGVEDLRGVVFNGGGTNYLVEGCYIHKFVGGLVAGNNGIGGAGILTNVNFRRNIVVDNFSNASDPGHGSQGCYMSDTAGALYEDNVIDANGWSVNFPSSLPSQFKRNVYIQNGCTGVVFRNNIVSRSDGIQLRPGGHCLANLFYQNAINLQFGSGNTPESGGVNGLVKGNVIIDGNNIGTGPDDGRGTGLLAGNVVGSPTNPAIWSYNIICNNVTGDRSRFNVSPITLNFDNGHGNPNGMHHCTFDHNIIYNWSCIGRESLIAWYTVGGVPYALEDITFSYNDLQMTLQVDGDAVFEIINFVTSTVNVPPEIHSDNNRIHRKGDNQNADDMFMIRGTDYKFDAYMALVHDTTSRYVEMTIGGGADQYPDPASGIPEYDLSVGGAGSVAHFFTQARLNSKAAWNDVYTAAPMLAYIQANFGMVVP